MSAYRNLNGIPIFLNEALLVMVDGCAEFIDPKTLQTMRKVTLPNPMPSADLSSPFTVQNGTALGCAGNTIFSLNPSRNKIEIIYSHIRDFKTPLVALKDFLLIVDQLNYLCCISFRGNLLWAAPFPSSSALRACLVADRLVVARSSLIEALDAQSGERLARRAERRVHGLFPCGNDRFVFCSKGALVCIGFS
jgi:hypothetical protein